MTKLLYDDFTALETFNRKEICWLMENSKEDRVLYFWPPNNVEDSFSKLMHPHEEVTKKSKVIFIYD